MLKVYLAGEIHTNWRDEIIDECKKQNLDIQFSSPVTCLLYTSPSPRD